MSIIDALPILCGCFMEACQVSLLSIIFILQRSEPVTHKIKMCENTFKGNNSGKF